MNYRQCEKPLPSAKGLCPSTGYRLAVVTVMVVVVMIVMVVRVDTNDDLRARRDRSSGQHECGDCSEHPAFQVLHSDLLWSSAQTMCNSTYDADASRGCCAEKNSLFSRVRATGALTHNAQLGHGPVDEGGFAVDQVSGNRAEVAAIAGDGAMVAHDEVVVGRHDHGSL